MSVTKVLLAVLVALAVTWLLLLVALVLVRPKGPLLREALRLLPDLLRLLPRLARDAGVPRAAKVRLWLLLGYLALPFDLIPDFIPVLGYADDAIVVAWVLRSVTRRAGLTAVERNWPGTPDGLAALVRLCRLADGTSTRTGPTSASTDSTGDSGSDRKGGSHGDPEALSAGPDAPDHTGPGPTALP